MEASPACRIRSSNRRDAARRARRRPRPARRLRVAAARGRASRPRRAACGFGRDRSGRPRCWVGDGFIPAGRRSGQLVPRRQPRRGGPLGARSPSRRAPPARPERRRRGRERIARVSAWSSPWWAVSSQPIPRRRPFAEQAVAERPGGGCRLPSSGMSAGRMAWARRALRKSSRRSGPLGASERGGGRPWRRGPGPGRRRKRAAAVRGCPARRRRRRRGARARRRSAPRDRRGSVSREASGPSSRPV